MTIEGDASTPRCAGRNQRTGERCKRAPTAGSATCSYHDPDRPRQAPRRGRSRPAADTPPAFTTQQLSTATYRDFETLFAPGTGWGRCGCLFALDARRVTSGGTWAEQRQANLATMRALVEQGRSNGILVYDGDLPVGWSQFVANEQLRFTDVAASGADWFLTCFVVDPAYRGLGVSRVALGAAVEAIGGRGGGVIEASATAIAPGPPPKTERKDLHVDGDVLYWSGVGKVRYGVEVEGVGAVAALYRSRRSMHGAPLGGTVDLFRAEGFEAVRVAPRPTSALADRIVMRRTA